MPDDVAPVVADGPPAGLGNLVSRLKQVVLPAPFGPISLWDAAAAIDRLTSFTATNRGILRQPDVLEDGVDTLDALPFTAA